MIANTVRRPGRWKSIAGLLCAYAGIIGTGFAAEPQTPAPQLVVRFGDLNLRDSTGVAVAYVRLVWAAERVCPFADSADHWLRVSSAPCVLRAVSQAVDTIGSPELRAYTQSQPLFRVRQTETDASR